MSVIDRAYFVCATPRSGSTLLCELLKATRVAGRPEEYFETLRSTGFPRQPRQYFEGVEDPAVLDLLPPVEPGEPETAFDLDAVLRAGTTPNGVFGAKVMWSHLDDLWPRVGGRSPEDVFPRLRYVQVLRRDKAAQAVSLWTAIQTQRWRDEGAPPVDHDPVYSFGAIRHLAQEVSAHEAAWTEWLAGRDPVVVVYEELAAAPGDTVARVLDALGVQAAPPAGPRMRRQAGERSQQWRERFEREAA